MNIFAINLLRSFDKSGESYPFEWSLCHYIDGSDGKLIFILRINSVTKHTLTSFLPRENKTKLNYISN